MKRAIVIMYDGNEVPKSAIGDIMASIESYQPAKTDVKVLVYNDTDIANALVNTTAAKGIPIPKVVETRTPEDEAVIFLGNKYIKNIGLNTDLFPLQLALDYGAVQKTPKALRTDEDKAFINAVHIIGSKQTLSISKSLIKKYNFNESVIKNIHNIYQNLTIN